jgi:hypothetical protein
MWQQHKITHAMFLPKNSSKKGPDKYQYINKIDISI